MMSNAELPDGSYSRSIRLFVETEVFSNETSLIVEHLIENRPSVFWTNLLKLSH